MSVIVRGGTSGNDLHVKGAAECVLARCTHVLLPDGTVAPLDTSRRSAIDAAVADMATHALRCLACATRPLKKSDLGTYDGSHTHAGHAELQDLSKYEQVESGLTFVGLVGLQDPPRPEVAAAIADCALAGIRVVVITGVQHTCVTDPDSSCCIAHTGLPAMSSNALGTVRLEYAAGWGLRHCMRSTLRLTHGAHYTKQFS